MPARVFDPLRLDVLAFAQDAGELGGRWSLQRFERIASMVNADAPSADGQGVVWSARGEQRAVRGEPARARLHLKAATCMRLQCQRCLQPVSTEIDIDRWFIFVAGEEAAAQIDADSDDDVLALTRALDLPELVEDELLLALPLVPRHEACPSPLLAPGDVPLDAEAAPHPFAALAGLKRGGSLN